MFCLNFFSFFIISFLRKELFKLIFWLASHIILEQLSLESISTISVPRLPRSGQTGKVKPGGDTRDSGPFGVALSGISRWSLDFGRFFS